MAQMYQPSRERIERLTAIYRERHLQEREQQERWVIENQPRRVIKFVERGLCDRQRLKVAEMLMDPSNQ